MKIVVLDYHTCSCDILENVDDDLIEEKYNGEIEEYLTEHCDYRLSNISWMAGDIDIYKIDKSE